MPLTAADIATHLGGEVLGDGSVQLTGFAAADKARTGDLTFAEQCARSACALIRESDGGVALHFWRESAERQLQSVLDVRAAVEAQPARFLLRPRFGPFPVSKL